MNPPTFLMYGEWGMEKTRTGVLKFPKPLADFDFEGGTTSLRGDLELTEPPPNLPAQFTAYHCKTEPFPGPVYIRHYNTGERKQYLTVLEDIAALKMIARGLKLASVLGDGVSNFSKLAQIYTTGLPLTDKQKRKMSEEEIREFELGVSLAGIEDWNPINERLRQVVRSIRDFRSLGCLVVCTCLEQLEMEGFGTPNPVVTGGKPNLPGKTRGEIPGDFDEVWHIANVKLANPEGGVREFRAARTAPHGIWHAKSRLNLPDPLSLEKIPTIISRLISNSNQEATT